MRWKIALVVCSVLILLVLSDSLASEKVILTADDGYRITGNFTKADGKAGVVVLHMYRNDKESWQPLVEKLTARGITSLAIDMRGHGDSKLDPKGNDDSKRVLARDAKLFNRMHQDAEAAVRYLLDKGIDPQRIGLIGASVGCSVAIHTVSENKVPVGAVVVMTPGKEYLGVPTMRHIKDWRGQPLFILTSKEEEERGAKAIYNQLKGKGAELRVFDEEDVHGTNMFGEVEGVEKMIAAWMAEKLR